jgi:hypothetical protein
VNTPSGLKTTPADLNPDERKVQVNDANEFNDGVNCVYTLREISGQLEGIIFVDTKSS